MITFRARRVSSVIRISDGSILRRARARARARRSAILIHLLRSSDIGMSDIVAGIIPPRKNPRNIASDLPPPRAVVVFLFRIALKSATRIYYTRSDKQSRGYFLRPRKILSSFSTTCALPRGRFNFPGKKAPRERLQMDACVSVCMTCVCARVASSIATMHYTLWPCWRGF